MLPGPLAAGGPELPAKVAIGQQALQCVPEGLWVATRNDDSGLAVHDEVAEAADRSRDDRPPMGHRLKAGDTEALPVGRAGDDGCARVHVQELGVRNETERTRHLRPKRPVSGDDQVQSARGLDELDYSFLGRESTGV